MAEVRLACALRFLAGGQVLDLREIYAVNEATKIEFLIDDNQKLKILEADFCAISRKRK
jgi:hypothetical protein